MKMKHHLMMSELAALLNYFGMKMSIDAGVIDGAILNNNSHFHVPPMDDLQTHPTGLTIQFCLIDLCKNLKIVCTFVIKLALPRT